MSIFRKQYTKSLPMGATLFDKQGERWARWTDRHGHQRTARLATNTETRISLETKTFVARYRDADGVIHENSTGCRTKNGAASVQAKLRRRVEMVRSGVLNADEDAAAQHGATPLNEHVTAYLEALSLTACPMHVKNVTHQITRITKECNYRTLQDLRSDALIRWLLIQRRANVGARTANTYRAAIVAFAQWCVENRRLVSNPFTKVPHADEKADPRHKRRALAEEEVQRLLITALWRPLAEYGRPVEHITPDDLERPRKRSNWRRQVIAYDSLPVYAARNREILKKTNPTVLATLELKGRERMLIYKTLLLTGLRKGELASLTVGQLELDIRPPRLVLKAADEKNRQGSTLPLREDLAREITEFLDARAVLLKQRNRSSERLFNVPAALDRVFNQDLAVAGIAKRDSRNYVVDVHALRHTFGTQLCRAGVPLRTAQAAMRHSDPKLTANVYTDPVLLDVGAAIDSLPRFSIDVEKPSKEIRATA